MIRFSYLCRWLALIFYHILLTFDPESAEILYYCSKKMDLIEVIILGQYKITITLTWKMPDWFDAITAKLWQCADTVALPSFCRFSSLYHIFYKRNHCVRKIQSIRCIVFASYYTKESFDWKCNLSLMYFVSITIMGIQYSPPKSKCYS